MKTNRPTETRRARRFVDGGHYRHRGQGRPHGNTYTSLGSPNAGKTYNTAQTKHFPSSTSDSFSVQDLKLSVKAEEGSKRRHLKRNGELTDPKAGKSNAPLLLQRVGRLSRLINKNLMTGNSTSW
jgi:hypothetical protein